MGETNANDVLRRKAKAGREEHQARVMSPVRAMRLALSRSAETLFELALSVTGVQNEQLGQDALLRSFDDDMLFIVLDGPDGALGAAALETSLVSGFVEKQTIGRVSAANGDKRIATATDAALVAPYVTRVLGEMSEHLGTEDGKLTDGFRFGARVETKRHLGLMIEAPDYQVLRAQLELEGGMRRGEIVICLPIEKPSQQGADTKGRGPSSEGGEASRALLKDGALMDARATLRAVIHRRQIMLGELSELKAGTRLLFAASALGRIELDAGPSASRLGPCKLGKQDGMRALKVQFGAKAEEKGVFEAIGKAAAEEPVPETASYSFDTSLTVQPHFTVDDMPDLSDLPSFEAADGAEATEARGEVRGHPSEISNVG